MANSGTLKKTSAAILGLSLLFATAAVPKSKGEASLQVSVSDEGSPAPRSIVALDRLKNEDCARVFSTEPTSGTDPKKDLERAQNCVAKAASAYTDAKGFHSFEKLADGWYYVRLAWPMSHPPITSEPVGCKIDGWWISYVPSSEVGKLHGLAQGPVFELKNGETKRIDFDYNGHFKIEKDCPSPIKFMHR
jgi:hypothetical protein